MRKKMHKVYKSIGKIAVHSLLFFAIYLSVVLNVYAQGAIEEECRKRNLSVEQCRKLTEELTKTGGSLTPEIVRRLKKNPEYQGLSPEEISKGEELLKKSKEKEGLIDAQEQIEPEEPTKEISLFDRYLESSSQEISTKLKPFGYDLFRSAPLTPPQDLPVASDYLVGVGDEVKVLLWGRVNADYSLTVSREGTLLFPNIGPLSVAGMTFKEMKEFLTKEAKNIVGAEVSVTMGRLRSIQVFVLGEAKKPGAYTVSAMSTLANALLAAGGPTQIGTLRKIELKRANKTISTMDFYDLLLQGNKSKDLRLQNGDVVFIPVVGPLVGIAGNVKRPAVYELKEATDITKVLDLAGGIIPTAYTQQVQVERVKDNQERVIIDLDTGDSKKARGFMLQDADLVKVFSIVDKDVNVVFLYGNAKRPGKYELRKGMRLKDIIKTESDLLGETCFDYGLIKRLSPPNLEVTLIPFDLGAVLFQESEEENIELAPQDSIYIFSKWIFKERPTVRIEGEVRRAGNFPFEKNLTIKDLVLVAGGVTKNVSYDDLELYRTDPETRKVTLLRFNLAKAMADDEIHNVRLQNQDRVVVHSVLEKTPERYVTISGDVNKPGEYPYASNMTVKDLIFAAGNLLESAYLEEAELASHIVEEGKSSLVQYQTIDLGKALAGDPAQNLSLKPDDSFFVKRITDWWEEKRVEIQGEVKFPGNYIIKKGERLSSVIERAGGFTDQAFLQGAIFIRESVRQLQQKSLDESIDRLEQKMLSSAAVTIEKALSLEAAEQEQAAGEQRKELLVTMRAAKAKGRISIRLDNLRGTPFDIPLEAGDTLTIPETPNQIQVVGAVYNQHAFIYDPEGTVSSYLKKTGGFTRDADEKEIYILKVDGTAISKKEGRSFFSMRWDTENHRWITGGFMSSRLDQGDTIVVPEKIEKIAWLREVKDITQILYQIATTAGVLIVAF